MKKIEVIIQMEKAATARTEWATRKREFDSNYDRVMLRLVYEGLAIRMTAAEMAHAASIPTSRMRDFMKRHGIKPSERRTVLSDLAGHALKTNAELLGIDPVNMDLTSPLAYLPMGNALRTQLQDATVAGVIPEYPTGHQYVVIDGLGGPWLAEVTDEYPEPNPLGLVEDILAAAQ